MKCDLIKNLMHTIYMYANLLQDFFFAIAYKLKNIKGIEKKTYGLLGMGGRREEGKSLKEKNKPSNKEQELFRIDYLLMLGKFERKREHFITQK